MSFPRHPAYKESGQEWLGSVPQEWDVKPLKHAAKLITRKTDTRTFPVGLENVEGWSGKFIDVEGEYEGEGVAFTEGDVLFGKLRPYLAKAWLADRSGEAVGDFHVLRATDGCIPEFLQRVILTHELIFLIDGSTFGAKMPRASWEFMGTLRVPIPPPAEQAIITTFLDCETAKIDALIAEQERLIWLLKEKRQAVISQAVTKGLDQNTEMKGSGVVWLGEVPEHWGIRKLRQLARLESGHTPSRQRPEYWIEDECVIPWFTLADVGYLRVERNTRIASTSQKISQVGLENSAARFLPSNTVILSRTASVGFSGIIDFPLAVSQDFAAWICKPELDPTYLLFCLRAMKPEFKRFMMGSTHQTIYMPDIEAFRVPFPPLSEQIAIVEFIQAATGEIDTLSSEANSAFQNRP